MRTPQLPLLGGSLAAALVAVAAAGQEPSPPLPEVERFNLVAGTQTIGAAYQFTAEARLVETAQAILDMGSNVLKFAMGPDYGGKPGANVPATNPAIRSLRDLARDEPAHRRVLDMPFAHYLVWVYPFSPGWWDKGYAADARERQSRELYEFGCYLLNAYSGSGKTFYLGHWEGDWHLRAGYNAKDDTAVTPEAIQGMIGWLNARQQAVDDAKRDTPHHDVELWHYTEVNLVKAFIGNDRPCVTNRVLPKVNVDFVSYSSYDSGTDLKPALDYIGSKLPPKPGVPGKRVFIGEYGFPAAHHSPAEQERKACQVIRAGLEWGCPFVLYWEMYNNEVDKDGRQRGFWLIDDQGRKQPLYDTHQRYYRRARDFVRDFRRREGRLPSPAEFAHAAPAFLDAP